MKFYVGATRQNDGKTLTCLGMIAAIKKRVNRVGYIKPIGQRFVEIEGHKIDEDSLLVKDVYKLDCDLVDMSPVAVPRKFTENYIDNPQRQKLIDDVTSSFSRINAKSDVVIVEGTGHAGVGSVFDMSNGDVAAMLGCKAVIVSSGGIGKPIDEIMLNKAMFDMAGVEIIGAIINKVEDEKFEKVSSYVKRGLERKGIELLGVIPYRPVLSSPTIEQLLEDMCGELISKSDCLQVNVSKTIIGAMPPHQALEYLTPETLLITPGTRDDLILTAMSSCLVNGNSPMPVAGIILTGGTPPHFNIKELIKKSHIPVIMVDDDTYSVASRIAKLIVKIRSTDIHKIEMAEELVDKYVDVDRIFEKARK